MRDKENIKICIGNIEKIIPNIINILQVVLLSSVLLLMSCTKQKFTHGSWSEKEYQHFVETVPSEEGDIYKLKGKNIYVRTDKKSGLPVGELEWFSDSFGAAMRLVDHYRVAGFKIHFGGNNGGGSNNLHFLKVDDPAREAQLFYNEMKDRGFEEPRHVYAIKGDVHCSYMSSHQGRYIKNTRVFVNKKIDKESNALCFVGGYHYHAGQKQIFNRGFGHFVQKYADGSKQILKGNNVLRYLYMSSIPVGKFGDLSMKKVMHEIALLNKRRKEDYRRAGIKMFDF